MVITRTPFRVSLCGGGSDLASFYTKNGGCVISTTINKYMYITIHPSFQNENTVLKYSQTEIVTDLKQIEHKIFKACLQNLDLSGVEITSIADIPQGTGLGSSSSFTVGLLNAINCYKRQFISKEELAQKACEIEIDQLKSPIGKQDQYAASYGGLNYYQFNKDGTVFVEPVLMSKEAFHQLESNLVMLYIGGIHSASEILTEQSKNMSNTDKELAQIKLCELTTVLKKELECGNVDSLGKILDESWKLKKTLASKISNPQIDLYYDKAIKNGALGGKLLGAGGCGFLLFYVPNEKKKHFLENMSELPELDFKFDHQGTIPIFVS